MEGVDCGGAVTGFCELTLAARDPVALARFYASCFALRELAHEEDRVWLAVGDKARLGLWRRGEKEFGDEGGAHVHFAFAVAPGQLEAIAERARAAQRRVEGPIEHDGGDRSLYVHDPEGNVVEAWDYFERGRTVDSLSPTNHGKEFLMRATRMIDTTLDRTIALGYGNVGLVVRRHLPDWPADPPRMDGKVVLVTGAASGLGLAAAKGFAGLGASVCALARDERRADDAVAQIQEAVPGAEVRGVACDISNLEQLHAFAEHFASEEARLDVLVNNAGVMPAERERSPDGHELMFATHVLAPFALTCWLQKSLQRNAPSRVINVSSGGMYDQRLPGEDLQSDVSKYAPKKLYARSKRAQVVITEQWAERLKDTGVVVHSMHPGWADTKGVQNWMPVFRAITRPIIRSPEAGADTIVWLGAAPEPLRSTGRFWHDRRQRPTHYLIGAGEDSEADRRRLWTYCEALVEARSG